MERMSKDLLVILGLKFIPFWSINLSLLSEAESEIERYIVWPGQALSYKVGMIKILELREKAMSELGDKFNIKDFHSAVLDHGNPPLFIVEEMVNNMIRENLN